MRSVAVVTAVTLKLMRKTDVALSRKSMPVFYKKFLLQQVHPKAKKDPLGGLVSCKIGFFKYVKLVKKITLSWLQCSSSASDRECWKSLVLPSILPWWLFAGCLAPPMRACPSVLLQERHTTINQETSSVDHVAWETDWIMHKVLVQLTLQTRVSNSLSIFINSKKIICPSFREFPATFNLIS